MAAGNVLVGDRLGLYIARLARAAGAAPTNIAERTR